MKQIRLVCQFDFDSTRHRDVTVGGWWLSLGCSCLYENEVDESNIKQGSLIFQRDVYPTPRRDATVRGWSMSLGRSCLCEYEVNGTI